ncbi:MAG: ATP-binding protein [Candidatus Zipacnadales bacterium]
MAPPNKRTAGGCPPRHGSPGASDFSLADLVPIETLARLKIQFETVTGLPMVVTDARGFPITALHEPVAFCGSLVRTEDNRTLCLRRKHWDVPETDLEERLRAEHATGLPVAHRCRGGFRDTAAPIVVEGHLIGYVVFARTLTHEPDLEHFRKLARESGHDPELGEAVAHAVRVMPQTRVEAIASLIQTLAKLVASAACESIRAQQIIELEELRDALIHMIVHDLRTPLTSLIGSLETVIEAEYEGETAEALLPLALSSAEQLLEMVNTLLDINKMESGAFKLENAQEINFREIATAALEQVRGLADEHGHELTSEINTPDSVQGDPDLLQRVVVNLLGNAIKFTQNGGHIKLSAHTNAEGLTFSVTDDGPGIPPEDQQRIFEKFGQAQSHKEGRQHSTGLGLTFCKMVAEAHGGHITLESQVGKGSTFTVFIPRRLPTQL